MLILGDNPFFGVNHASVDKASSYRLAAQNLDWSRPLDTISAAIDCGVTHLMMSAHAEAPELLRAMAADGRGSSLSLIPAVPYLHRLNGIVATQGIPKALASSVDFIAGASAVLRGGTIKAAGLYAFIMRETQAMERYGFNVPYVALQNIFTDLLLGLGQHDVINEVAEMLGRRGRRLVAITMNPLLADRVLARGISVCTHYNCLGYMVQPNPIAFVEWLGASDRAVWAMGVMASGRAQLSAVLADPILKRFDAVVLGASRPSSIQSFAAGYAVHG